MVRTEIMIARELLAAGTPGLRFCSFDRHIRGYREISRARAERLLHEADSKREPRDARKPRPNPMAAAKARMERASLACIGWLPERMRSPVHAWLAAWMQLARTSVGMLRAIPPARRSHDHADALASFGAGDLYLSMGADWDYNDLTVLGEIRRRLGLKVFLMCYDLIPIYQSHFAVPGYHDKFATHFKNLVSCADAVFTISEESWRQLRRYAAEENLPLPPTEVIRLGANVRTTDEEAIHCLASQSFVLTVGTVEVRKNHRLLYRLWTRMRNDPGFPDPPQLVIVGRRGWSVGDLIHEMNEHPDARGFIHHFENVSDEQLNWLYNNCLFTVYPSFYEGLGLPVLESLAHGKYCLSSNTSSLPEAGQNLTMLLDPLDFAAWYGSINSLVLDGAFRREQEARIRAGFKSRSWQDTAQAVYGFMQAIGT